MGESLNRKNIITGLVKTKAIPMITATISPTGRRVEVVFAQEKNTDENPDDIKIQTRMARLKICCPHCRSA